MMNIRGLVFDDPYGSQGMKLPIIEFRVPEPPSAHSADGEVLGVWYPNAHECIIRQTLDTILEINLLSYMNRHCQTWEAKHIQIPKIF